MGDLESPTRYKIKDCKNIYHLETADFQSAEYRQRSSNIYLLFKTSTSIMGCFEKKIDGIRGLFIALRLKSEVTRC